ncbi:MAG: hypothetical protein ABIZ36_05170 [Gemmatimonadaceae bacterium]
MDNAALSNAGVSLAIGSVVLTETGPPSLAEHMTVPIKGEKFVERAVSRKTHGAALAILISSPRHWSGRRRKPPRPGGWAA